MPPSSSNDTIQVGMLTSGGLAPCLSSSIAALIDAYAALNQKIEVRLYHAGYKGLLTGSPIGSSRVKLTNKEDCVKRGFVKKGEDPLEVAAEQLKVDNIHILHTIGGDDTNTQAALLSAHLLKNGYSLTVIGMPKTIDNDVHPIKQTFGADTASIESAKFFRRIVAEGSASPRMLIIHEVMGRDCGYLTARSAHVYREMLRSDEDSMSGCELWGLGKGKRDIHAVFIPEIPIDLPSIGARLKTVMDDLDVVNVFLSEGAGVSDIVSQMESEGQPVPRDAFGHVQLAKINPGEYLSKRLGSMVNAEKTLVQKSGYFARAAPSNDFDQRLIEKCARVGAECAMRGVSGCMGQDEERGDEVRPIEFERIRGGKVFDINTDWFQEMMGEVEAYGNGK